MAMRAGKLMLNPNMSQAKQLGKNLQAAICNKYLQNEQMTLGQLAECFGISYTGARNALIRQGIAIRRIKAKPNTAACRKKIKYFNSPQFCFNKLDDTLPDWLYVYEIHYKGKILAKIGRSKYLNYKHPCTGRLRAIWPMDDRLDSAIYEQAILAEFNHLALHKSAGICGCSEWLSMTCEELIDIIEDRLEDYSFYDEQIQRLCR